MKKGRVSGEPEPGCGSGEDRVWGEEVRVWAVRWWWEEAKASANLDGGRMQE